MVVHSARISLFVKYFATTQNGAWKLGLSDIVRSYFRWPFGRWSWCQADELLNKVINLLLEIHVCN